MARSRIRALHSPFKAIAGIGLCLFALPAATPMGVRPEALGTAAKVALSQFSLRGPEAQLVRTLFAIRQNRLDEALAEVDRLVAEIPNFRLAHLIRGDLLLSRSRPLETLGNVAAEDSAADRVEELREEARARLARYRMERPIREVPRYLLQMPPKQRHALVVDTALSTLYLFENVGGEPRYVADYYMTSGRNGVDKLRAGDKKTPLGVYLVADAVPRAKLTDFYGPGAWPLNYPNEIDRRNGRRGYGIWIHGTPSDTYARAPRASDGCVVLNNADFEDVSTRIQPGTTAIVIADRIEWSNPRDLKPLRDELAGRVEAWRRDWESRDVERYLAHYSAEFRAGRMTYARWAAKKREVAAEKTSVRVGIDQLSISLYPGNPDLAVVLFEQDYAANDLAEKSRKRQYWHREQGVWRIIHEGAA
jgi:murein L,D-transpeptidase YafK